MPMPPRSIGRRPAATTGQGDEHGRERPHLHERGQAEQAEVPVKPIASKIRGL